MREISVAGNSVPQKSSESTQHGTDGHCQCKTFLGPVQKLRCSHTNTVSTATYLKLSFVPSLFSVIFPCKGCCYLFPL